MSIEEDIINMPANHIIAEGIIERVVKENEQTTCGACGSSNITAKRNIDCFVDSTGGSCNQHLNICGDCGATQLFMDRASEFTTLRTFFWKWVRKEDRDYFNETHRRLGEYADWRRLGGTKMSEVIAEQRLNEIREELYIKVRGVLTTLGESIPMKDVTHEQISVAVEGVLANYLEIMRERINSDMQGSVGKLAACFQKVKEESCSQ